VTESNSGRSNNSYKAFRLDRDQYVKFHPRIFGPEFFEILFRLLVPFTLLVATVGILVHRLGDDRDRVLIVASPQPADDAKTLYKPRFDRPFLNTPSISPENTGTKTKKESTLQFPSTLHRREPDP